jgi:PGF-pre-PGF domain-containing protein
MVIIAIPSKLVELIGISEIEAVLDKSMSVSVAVSKASLPSGIPAPEGDVYVYFEIVFTEYGTSNVVEPSGYMNFRISKEWLSDVGADATDVIFLKWDGEWIELPTELIDEDDDYFYFRVSLDSFSFFAIITEEKVSLPISVSETPAPTEMVVPAEPAEPEEITAFTKKTEMPTIYYVIGMVIAAVIAGTIVYQVKYRR